LFVIVLSTMVFLVSCSNSNVCISEDMALAPRLGYDSKIFICESGDMISLPSNFTEVGEITGIAGANELGDFQSTFGKVGTKIYANSDKPDAVYVHYNDAEQGKYTLFVTQELMYDWVMYNGKQFRNIGGVQNWVNELPNNSDLVGSVDTIILDEKPTANFQSNIRNASEVFLNGDTIFVKVADDNEQGFYYVKLTKISEKF